MKKIPGSSARNLPSAIVAAARHILDSRGGLYHISALPLPRLVADSADKFIAFSNRGDPLAIIVIAPKTHPRTVQKAAERASLARQRLGPQLGAQVLAPMYVGESEGVSFSITEYCQPFGDGRLRSRWTSWRLADGVFDWLRASTEYTVQAIDATQIDTLYAVPLARMAQHPAIGPENRAAAQTALDALNGGRWAPKAILCHYDFWMGNLLHAPASPLARYKFVVIDWAGSNVLGHGIYDLVRMSISLRASPARWRRELAAHSGILGCEPAQARHYLLSTLGHMAGALGEWPVERFAQTVAACMRYIDNADTR